MKNMISNQKAIFLFERLAAQSFPEINPKRIKIIFVKKKEYYMAVKCFPFVTFLYIDTTALKFSEQAFTGCLAHELAHIAIHRKKSLIGRFIYFFGKSVTEHERDADTYVVVDKKLGKPFLQFHHEHNKVYKRYKASEGLTTKEIKRLMKSVPAAEEYGC